MEYRSGKLNGTTDVLSCREEDEIAFLSISTLTFTLFDKLCAEVQGDPEVATVHAQLEDETVGTTWSFVDGMLLFNDNFHFRGIDTLVEAAVPRPRRP
jgi:hypothetical protein